jgi:hypothetical protein
MYFDIDGSLLVGDTGEPKSALVDGAFELALRLSGVEHLICVGNFVDAGRAAKKIDPRYDIHGAIMNICGGIFGDAEWFRAHTSLVRDSYYRAAEVELDSDWWYLDDLAEYYFKMAYREDVFEENVGGRIFVPEAEGNGDDVLEWIEGM